MILRLFISMGFLILAVDMQSSSTTPVAINIAINKNPNVVSCFGRIRASTTTDRNFTGQFDRYIGSGRIDRLKDLLLETGGSICNSTELNELRTFLNSHQDAYNIIGEVVGNFSNAEKDHLNTMENLKDTLAEEQFYLDKFNNISPPDYQLLLRSYNVIMQTVMAAPMDQQLAMAVAAASNVIRN